jgi:hypothetical protein
MYEKSKFNYVSKLIDKMNSFVFFLLVRCHTDGFWSTQELDIKTGDQLGDLVYEGHYNVTIHACNQIEYL